jgi:hypothetical protein
MRNLLVSKFWDRFKGKEADPENASNTLPTVTPAKSELNKLKREALRIMREKGFDAHLFILFEELKSFSVLPRNTLAAAWQYPFLTIENIEMRVIQAELGGVVMKFITANLLGHKICFGFGVFPKSESDFRYSTNAFQLDIDDKKFVSATYVIRYSETGRNWRLIDVEEFHNLPEAEPLLHDFSKLVERHRVEHTSVAESEQLEAVQKKFSF